MVHFLLDFKFAANRLSGVSRLSSSRRRWAGRLSRSYLIIACRLWATLFLWSTLEVAKPPRLLPPVPSRSRVGRGELRGETQGEWDPPKIPDAIRGKLGINQARGTPGVVKPDN